ncbi:MAG: Gfo/Idh/MocA family oxidoreductase [Candidatus Poribacteria bacterium]|nr:Gfo/Idh/MocA family oxidoreductase [Candidatus Poribacteria bacterium]
MSRLGLGVIGLGVGKGALALNQRPDSPMRVCAVADKDPALLKLAHADYEVGFVTEDYHELLSRREVDVVGVFTPDHLHAEHAAAALEAGKHVICTKPMVTTMDDCDRLVRLVDGTGLKFVAAMTWRHLPKIVAARRAFDQGKLGKITLIDTGYVHDIRAVCRRTPWRVTAPQDFLFGGGAHAIDCVRWFAGDIEEVHAFAMNSGVIPGYPIEDTWMLNLKFASGALGRVSVICSAVNSPRDAHQRLVIYGTKGTLTGLDLGLDGVRERETLNADPPAHRENLIEGHAMELLLYFDKMARCILDDKAPTPSVRDGACVVAVALAAGESLSTGQAVKVRNDF